MANTSNQRNFTPSPMVLTVEEGNIKTRVVLRNVFRETQGDYLKIHGVTEQGVKIVLNLQTAPQSAAGRSQ